MTVEVLFLARGGILGAKCVGVFFTAASIEGVVATFVEDKDDEEDDEEDEGEGKGEDEREMVDESIEDDDIQTNKTLNA